MIDLRTGERIYRYEIPVDDQLHTLRLCGNPLFVACRESTIVEFWARYNNPATALTRSFVVVGTGQPLTFAQTYWGTALAPNGLVWHLMEAP